MVDFGAIKDTKVTEGLRRRRLKNALQVRAESVLDTSICGQLFGFAPRLGVTSRRRSHSSSIGARLAGGFVGFTFDFFLPFCYTILETRRKFLCFCGNCSFG